MGTGVVATAGYMYIAGNQSKRAAQSASIYSAHAQFSPIFFVYLTNPIMCAAESEQEGAGLTTGTTDARVGSEGVRAAVRGDKATLEKARH